MKKNDLSKKNDWESSCLYESMLSMCCVKKPLSEPLVKKIKVFFTIIMALLCCATMWGNDGDIFVAKSSEGIEMTFMVVNEKQKTCKVGTGEDNKTAIDQKQEGILTIPESVNGYTVVTIGRYAFYLCRKINEFHLPNTIKEIEYQAFGHNNWNLTEMDIPESVEKIGNYAFWNCEKLSHVYFHEGLKTIGVSAFQRCGLTSIDLPSSLEYINYDAFFSIPHLATVTIRSSTPIPHHERSRIFKNNTYTRATLYVPQGMKDRFKADNEWGCFRTIKEGEPIEQPIDIAYPEDFGRQYVVYGDPVIMNVNFVNKRDNPISSISYIPTIDGVEGEEQSYEFLEPIAANSEPFTLPVTLPDFDEPKTANVYIDITKINDEVVDFGADILPNASGTAAVFDPVPDHRVLIMDYTSNKCPWALRSNIGFEELKERYGDKVIRASFDISGPMWCEPLIYIPRTPTCVVDGFGNGSNYLIDPYFGEYSNQHQLGILDVVEGYMTRPHLGNTIITSAQWANEEQTIINVETETTMGLSDAQVPFRLEYILIEDGLKGDDPKWEQPNGYAGQTVYDPYLQPLAQLPSTIKDMVYNDVAIGHYRNFNEGFQPFTFGEPQRATTTLKLSELTQSIIQNKGKLSVVVYLRDDSNRDVYNYGVLVDSYKSSISDYTSGVQSIIQPSVPHDVYDLSGRKVKAALTTLDNLPKGIYIYGGKKMVVK